MSSENQTPPGAKPPPREQPPGPDRPWLKQPRTMLPLAARLALDYLVISVGVLIFNLSLDWFLVPNQIAAGGLSGVARIRGTSARFCWSPSRSAKSAS
jgi:hypothetical protein